MQNQKESKVAMVLAKLLLSIVGAFMAVSIILFLIKKEEVRNKKIKARRNCIELLGGDDYAREKCTCDNPDAVIEQHLISE